MAKKRDNKTMALASFCSTIEATGGVMKLEDGLHAPVGDENWIDLGEAYLDACLALDRLPKIAPLTGGEEVDAGEEA